MKQLLTISILCLCLTNTVGAQENSTASIEQKESDSTLVPLWYIDYVNELIGDYLACEGYNLEIHNKLIEAEKLKNKYKGHSENYRKSIVSLKSALKEMTSRKSNMEIKLKRTRAIGIVGTIGGFIVGVLLVLFI